MMHVADDDKRVWRIDQQLVDPVQRDGSGVEWQTRDGERGDEGVALAWILERDGNTSRLARRCGPDRR
jgi:hypothetical protein